ncbi:hypothetical protein VTO42DRAFT_6808 [Malbranchea cinnamomea]
MTTNTPQCDAPLVPSRPPPVGDPPAWAETRTALCDTLGWYRSVQGGCYYSGGACYGFLLDADCGDRPYMDDEIVITRLGGGCLKSPDGQLLLKKSRTRKDKIVEYVTNTMHAGIPVGVIIGNRNTICPSTVPHRYNVMDFFRITHFWFEAVGDKAGARLRLEKIDLDRQSWWAPQGSPPRLPFDQRSDKSPVFENACSSCGTPSPQVYAQGWMCLEGDCKQFWLMNGSYPSDELTYNPQFLSMRSRHPQNIRPPHSLAPDLLTKFGKNDPLKTTSRCAWRGVVCPLCKRCISRIYWEGWVCETAGCSYEYRGQVRPIPLYSVLEEVDLGTTGHRMPYFGNGSEPRPTITYMKNYRKDTFLLPGIGTVTHFSANNVVNSRPGGPNDIFEGLQVAKDLGLRRYGLKQSKVTETLTSHFAVNYGMPYKYVVDVDSRPFNQAPAVLLSALGRLTWATKNSVAEEEFLRPNELLTLGYFEKMSIGYHDDGEESLGPTIATLSLGSKAVMSVRMKDKYFRGYTSRANNKTGTQYIKPLNQDPILPGCALYGERRELERLYRDGHISKEQYDSQRVELLEKVNRKEASPLIVIELHHGDLVVMHGENLQKYYEHSVKPEGDIRFAITARYIKPELVSPSEHWKGNFILDPAFEYDGDEKYYSQPDFFDGHA